LRLLPTFFDVLVGEGMAKVVGAAKYLIEMILGKISPSEYLKTFLLDRFLELG
jgi:hypothetical protein